MSRRRGALHEIIGATAAPRPGEGRGGGAETRRPAVFLDRDGTIIADVGFIDDPDQARLLPGVAGAIRAFNRAGFLVVVVSNQSGVARGLFGEDTVRRVNERVRALLEKDGAQIDAFYHCPYLEGADAVVAEYRKASDWRKPEPGMILTAAGDLGIDLKRSWVIGDASRDVEAGRRAGCRTILLGGNGRSPARRAGGRAFGAAGLEQAARIVERQMQDDDTPTRTSDAPETVTDERSRWSEGVSLLREVRDLLDRSVRSEQQADFSLRRLVGSLLQMLAAVAGVWGLIALLGDRGADATPRLLLACFLQLAAGAALLAERFR